MPNCESRAFEYLSHLKCGCIVKDFGSICIRGNIPVTAEILIKNVWLNLRTSYRDCGRMKDPNFQLPVWLEEVR